MNLKDVRKSVVEFYYGEPAEVVKAKKEVNKYIDRLVKLKALKDRLYERESKLKGVLNKLEKQKASKTNDGLERMIENVEVAIKSCADNNEKLTVQMTRIDDAVEKAKDNIEAAATQFSIAKELRDLNVIKDIDISVDIEINIEAVDELIRKTNAIYATEADCRNMKHV